MAGSGRDHAVEATLAAYALSTRYRLVGQADGSLPPTLAALSATLDATSAHLIYLPYYGPTPESRSMAVALVTGSGLEGFADLDFEGFLAHLSGLDSAVQEWLSQGSDAHGRPDDMRVLEQLANYVLPQEIAAKLFACDRTRVGVSAVAELTRIPMETLIECHSGNRTRIRPVTTMVLGSANKRGTAVSGNRWRVFYFGLTDASAAAFDLSARLGDNVELTYCAAESSRLDDLLEISTPADILVYFGHADYSGGGPGECAINLGGHREQLTDVVGALCDRIKPSIVVLAACGVGILDTWTLWRSREVVGPVEAALSSGADSVIAPLWPQYAGLLWEMMTDAVGSMCRGTAPAEALSNAVRVFRLNRGSGIAWPAWAGVSFFGSTTVSYRDG